MKAKLKFDNGKWQAIIDDACQTTLTIVNYKDMQIFKSEVQEYDNASIDISILSNNTCKFLQFASMCNYKNSNV